jgi:serine/threonine-protein kinase
MQARLIPVLAIGLAALAPSAAWAQPSPDARAAAAALFEDAKKLMADGKYEQACPKLAESNRIDPGMGTLYNLAACYEQTGRTASAWVGFRDVEGMAMAAGQSEREKVARGRAAALEPKLMRLKITVQPAAQSAGVEVKRDGAVVAPALWGTSVPLDPGKHVISASAPDRAPWELTVTLEKQGETVTVDVPPLLEKKPAPPVTAPPGPVSGPAAPPVEAPPDAPAPRPWQRPLGIAATAVGAVGLGLGVGFGFMAKSAFDGSNTSGNCDAKTNHCNPMGLTQRSDAVQKGNVGTGVFIAGAVLAAGGVVLWATAPSAKAAARTGVARPEIGIGPGSVAVRGSF